ncbi:hypothetical protein ES332_A12G169900v1 [Gossypium tomentosum]|uniref:Uncharacterized protein n=1 Tax=Gossypium tomentosum TaxID=34277 RepID=A0A5D2MXL8_GOSTO|nr:hypothetical protein ES332_A12G169900v1 [Gossypium tomentosum]
MKIFQETGKISVILGKMSYRFFFCKTFSISFFVQVKLLLLLLLPFFIFLLFLLFFLSPSHIFKIINKGSKLKQPPPSHFSPIIIFIHPLFSLCVYAFVLLIVFSVLSKWRL